MAVRTEPAALQRRPLSAHELAAVRTCSCSMQVSACQCTASKTLLPRSDAKTGVCTFWSSTRHALPYMPTTRAAPGHCRTTALPPHLEISAPIVDHKQQFSHGGRNPILAMCVLHLLHCAMLCVFPATLYTQPHTNHMVNQALAHAPRVQSLRPDSKKSHTNQLSPNS